MFIIKTYCGMICSLSSTDNYDIFFNHAVHDIEKNIKRLMVHMCFNLIEWFKSHFLFFPQLQLVGFPTDLKLGNFPEV